MPWTWQVKSRGKGKARYYSVCSAHLTKCLLVLNWYTQFAPKRSTYEVRDEIISDRQYTVEHVVSDHWAKKGTHQSSCRCQRKLRWLCVGCVCRKALVCMICDSGTCARSQSRVHTKKPYQQYRRNTARMQENAGLGDIARTSDVIPPCEKK